MIWIIVVQSVMMGLASFMLVRLSFGLRRQAELNKSLVEERDKLAKSWVDGYLEYATTEQLLAELKNRPLVRTIILCNIGDVNHINVNHINKDDALVLLHNAAVQIAHAWNLPGPNHET
jgi:hypothetical protein